MSRIDYHDHTPKRNSFTTGFGGCFGGTLGIIAAIILIPSLVCGGCFGLGVFGWFMSLLDDKKQEQVSQPPKPQKVEQAQGQRDKPLASPRPPTSTPNTDRDPEPSRQKVNREAEELKAQAARELKTLREEEAALVAKIADREAVYKKRIDSGGADGATRNEIAKLKEQLMQVRSSIKALELE